MEELLHEDEIPVGRAKDLRGQRIGNLTVLYRVQGNNSQTRWKCLCDCGNITYHYANNLNNNKITHSCGCLSKRGDNLVNGDGYQGKNKIDITGQKFGRLTVIKDSGERKGKEVVWLCKCDCGETIKVRSYDLRHGHTSSCGCLRSKGEEKIKIIFSNNQINYISQKTFPTCVNDRGNLLKFDFYVFTGTSHYCIEYDGDIHFDTNKSHGWFTEEYREDMRKRDQYKNQWCKENNIPLIRIPYTKLDTLCIEDLMLETTQFRVV